MKTDARDSFKALTRGIGYSWFSEAEEADTAKETLVDLVYRMRYVSMLSQTAHWFVSGATSKQDHELMKMVYEGLNDMLDSVAERLVGTKELDASDLTIGEQAKAVAGLSPSSNSLIAAMHDGKAAAKIMLSEIEGIKKVINSVVESPSITDGTRNMLEGHSDELDQMGYHLGQRVK